MDKILSILGSVGFNWHVALANFINFLIILFILNRFFFRKLGKTLDDRKRVIEQGIANADEAAKALSSAEEKKKEIIHDAKKESHIIIEEAKSQAEALALSIKDSAEKDAEAKMHMLSKKEAELKDSVEKEVAQSLPSVVAKLYAETLRRNLTEEENNKLIAQIK